jgi:undecaprenyl-diphosphatase
MTLFLLLVVALATGLLAYALSRRYPSPMTEQAPARAAASMVETEAERHPGLERMLRERLDPATATGLVLTLALLVVGAGLFVLGVLAYLTRSSDALADLDSAVGQWGADNASEWALTGLEWLTHLGDTWVCIAIAVVVAVVEMIRVPSRWVPVFLAVVIAGSVLIVNTAKELLDRVRPEFNPIAETLGPSFPSGHSAMAAAFWAAVALVLARRRSARVRALLSAGAVAIAVTVAGTRVLLGVHWLSDAIAGVAFGWAWFALVAIAFGGRLLELGAPVAEGTRDVPRAQTS